MKTANQLEFEEIRDAYNVAFKEFNLYENARIMETKYKGGYVVSAEFSNQRLASYKSTINHRIYEWSQKSRDMISKVSPLGRPTREYQVGQQVFMSCSSQPFVVKEVYGNGGISYAYKVTENSPGNHTCSVLGWFDLFDDNREEGRVFDIYTKMPHIDAYNKPMMSLYNIFEDDDIDMDPEYQRGDEWTLEEKQGLIISMYRNLNIGLVVLIRKEFKIGEQWYEVLDGRQRLKALRDWYFGRFSIFGKTYATLNTAERREFDRKNIMFGEILPMSRAEKYDLFLKLNTTGRRVSVNHIQKVRDAWQNEVGGPDVRSGY